MGNLKKALNDFMDENNYSTLEEAKEWTKKKIQESERTH